MSPTDFVVVCLLLLLLLWELWTVVNKIPGDTVSESIKRVSFRYPIVAFLAGVLAGHWWWPLCGTP